MKRLFTRKSVRNVVLAGVLLFGVSVVPMSANAAICVCNYELCLCGTVGKNCYCVPIW